MKKIIFAALIAALSMVAGSEAQAQVKQTVKDYVEVLYFHGKQRCVTCKAVGQYSKEVVEKDLATLTKQGKVRFREVDFSTPEGEKIAGKYKVSFSGLFVSQWKGGKEKYEDLTRFAFQYARTNTPKFKKDLTDKINRLLK